MTAPEALASNLKISGGASAEELAAVVVVLNAYASRAARPKPGADSRTRWRLSQPESRQYASPRNWAASA